MKKTLLQLTQNILEVMTSDEVNSITDTAEAEGVARIIMTTFDEMLVSRDWPSHKKLLKVESFSDNQKPTHFTVNEEIKELYFINYNKSKVDDDRDYFKPVKYKKPDDFLRYVNMRNSTKADTISVVDPSGITLLILNDKQPEYYTSFDDKVLVMDSWDVEIDDTLHEAKIQAYGLTVPSATFSDEWIPDLPVEAFSLLYQEALSTVRFQIDSVNDIKAEQKATRQNRKLSRKAWTVNGGIQYPSYGRRGRKASRDVTFRNNT